MADLGSSALLASMVVGMLTIPAASQTVETTEAVSGDMPNISASTEQLPQQRSTSTTSDSFTRTVSTAFQNFSTEITSSRAQTALESSDMSYEVVQESDGKKWILETSDGRLVIKQTPSKEVEKVETPYGTLKTVKSGGQTQSFEGSDRERVEEIRSELKELMKDKRKEVREMSNDLKKQRYRRALSLEVNEETPEHVVIENSMSQPVSLDGWELSNNNPDFYDEFDTEIPAESELHVYTGEQEDLNVTEQEEVNYVYDSGLTWEDGGDTATLWKDNQKVVVESYSN